MIANNVVYILDSFALMAWLEGEPGGDRVEEILKSAHDGSNDVQLSILNLGEVLYIVERERGLAVAQRTLTVIDQLPIEVLAATRKRVLSAAHIKANYPVSYADAFAIVASLETSGTVLTGDPEFQSVERLIRIEWLPQRND